MNVGVVGDRFVGKFLAVLANAADNRIERGGGGFELSEVLSWRKVFATRRCVELTAGGVGPISNVDHVDMP